MDIITSLTILIGLMILSAAIIYMQTRHYMHKSSEKEIDIYHGFAEELEEKIKEFNDYKKKVDALTIKNGFK